MIQMTSLVPFTPLALQPFPPSLFDSFLEYLDVRPTTARSYEVGLKSFAQYLSQRQISTPIRKDVLAYKAYLASTYKPATVQTYMAAVRIFFRWTANTNLYPNIADNIKGVRSDRHHKKDYLTTNQTRNLLLSVDTTKLRGLRDKAMLALMVTAGLRTIEVVRADVGDIRTVGDEVVLYVLGKGQDEKNEFVRLPHKTHDLILQYLKERSTKQGLSELTPDEPLFASVSNNNSGKRMTTRSIRRVAKEGLSHVGLTSLRYSAHSLRHTCACLNMINGGTLEETQQLLRHSAITTTMIYAHYLEAASNPSSQRVENAVLS